MAQRMYVTDAEVENDIAYLGGDTFFDAKMEALIKEVREAAKNKRQNEIELIFSQKGDLSHDEFVKKLRDAVK